MEYKFNFTSTHKDLIDSYKAMRNARSGLSSWSRGAILLLGLMWLLGFIFISPEDVDFTKSLIWFALGLFIVWNIVIKPYLEIKHIKESNEPEQAINLVFTDDYIEAISEEGERFTRKWDEVEAFQGFRKGVLIGFSDGIVNWLPLRVFESHEHKKQFVNAVVVKLKEMEPP